MSDNFDNLLDRLTKSTDKIQKPKKYAVVFHNDNFTTREFVTEMLQKHFKHSIESATSIMVIVHESGKGIAGIYSFEIAETKSYAVLTEAKAHEYPLRITLQPVEE